VPSSSLSPSEEYKKRQQAREMQVAHFENVHRRFGNIRLLLVIATLIAAWFSLHLDVFSPWWLLLALVLFLTIAILHAKVLRQRACAERAVDFYRKGLARIEDRWPGTGQTGERIDIHSSLYATDLDLFGQGSLFELLSLARTRMGEDTLAAWLLSPSPVAQLTQRHAAVAELRSCLDLREDIAILGEDLKVGIHPEALSRWAEAPNQLTHLWLRWLSLFFAIAAMAAAIVWAALGTKAPFFAIMIIETIIIALLRKRTDAVFHATEHALEDLQLLSSLLARLQREQFEAPRLQILKTELSSHHLAGSQAIARLRTIVEYIRSLDNPLMRILNIPLLYVVQVAYAAEAWRTAHGAAVRSWLAAIGEVEALLSLSAYSYEHPSDPFPEFLEGPPCFNAEQLGHPLIPAAKCVRNDISVCDETKVLLISGSNMSGKSTLMRAVGINTVLAMAGAPVRAQRLQLTPLQIGASILINDSLQEGSSRFYAEITRLRHICDLGEKYPPVHLQDEIRDGKMTFDFKLHDGVVTKSNGIELMRLIGLKV
jgi:MutS domain V